MVRIYTFADKRPDFIKWQAACIKYFFPKDTSYTVLNNGHDSVEKWDIQQAVSEDDDITYFDLPPEAMDHSNPNAACAVPLNWAWQNLLCTSTHNPKDIIVILDSDMFPVGSFEPIYYLAGHNIAGTYQKRGSAKYIWNGIMMFTGLSRAQMKEIDFGYGEVEGNLTDVGGKTHYFFKNNPTVSVRNILHTSHINLANKNMNSFPTPLRPSYDPKFNMELYWLSNGTCLHYGRGSNWDNMPKDYHKQKTAFLFKALEMALTVGNLFYFSGYIYSANEWEK